MTEICAFLKNWFNRRPDGSDFPKYKGTVRIADGAITVGGEAVPLAEGQYFRVLGSALNDGVYRFGESSLKDETFTGEIWEMAVPVDVVKVAADKAAWEEKYGVDSPALSPYNSESFGGYSYSKGGGSGAASVGSWVAVFGNRLTRYKKL